MAEVAHVLKPNKYAASQADKSIAASELLETLDKNNS
jgi:hypothetical protein